MKKLDAPLLYSIIFSKFSERSFVYKSYLPRICLPTKFDYVVRFAHGLRIL